MDTPGNAWVIVAIPDPDDYVWKLSSEKIPHMTVLFLGEPTDAASAQTMVEYMQHTADMSLSRFGMSVDRRGLLGPDDADVLFFEEDYSKKIREARSYLLKNEAIFKAYSSVEQYPEWTPHLTLGYPKTPAKPDKRDYPGISWVNFDRLALWTTDFAGFEVPLKRESGMVDVAMTDEVDDFLVHHGIKGMRWGVRKQRPSAGQSAPPAKVSPKKASAPEGKPDIGKGGRIVTAPKQAVPAGTAKKNHQMSDEELRKAINRIDMERKFAQLTKAPPSAQHAAMKFVTDILLDVGKQQAKVLLTGLATQQLAKKGIVAPKVDAKK